jgi:hypothetical protein
VTTIREHSDASAAASDPEMPDEWFHGLLFDFPEAPREP